MRTVLAALALSGCVATVSTDGAGIWRAYNSMTVVPVTDRANTFQVVSQPLAGPSDFVCAAGDYAQRRLGARGADRVYVLRGPGPSPLSRGRNAVTFTTEPDPALSDGPRPGEGGDFSFRIDEPGFSVTAASARSLCIDSRRRLTRNFL